MVGVAENNAISLQIGSYPLAFHGSLGEFYAIQRYSVGLARELTHRYMSGYYDVRASADDISKIEEIYNIGLDHMIEAADKIAGKLAGLGRYDVDKRYIVETYCSSGADTYWKETVQTLEADYHKIQDGADREKMEREIRKESRSRMVGGGFGLSGALKGMIEAGAINATTGAAHSLFNAIGNAATDANAKKARDALCDAYRAQIENGLLGAIYTLAMQAFLDELHIEVAPGVESRKSEAVVENAKKGIIPRENLEAALVGAIEADPENLEAYQMLLSIAPQYESDLHNVAATLGLEAPKQLLEGRHEFYGLKFDDLHDVESVKAAFAEFKEVVYKSCSDKGKITSIFANNEPKQAVAALMAYIRGSVPRLLKDKDEVFGNIKALHAMQDYIQTEPASSEAVKKLYSSIAGSIAATIRQVDENVNDLLWNNTMAMIQLLTGNQKLSDYSIESIDQCLEAVDTIGVLTADQKKLLKKKLNESKDALLKEQAEKEEKKRRKQEEKAEKERKKREEKEEKARRKAEAEEKKRQEKEAEEQEKARIQAEKDAEKQKILDRKNEIGNKKFADIYFDGIKGKVLAIPVKLFIAIFVLGLVMAIFAPLGLVYVGVYVFRFWKRCKNFRAFERAEGLQPISTAKLLVARLPWF